MCPVEERSAVVKRTENGFVCSECDSHLSSENMDAAHAALEEHVE